MLSIRHDPRHCACDATGNALKLQIQRETFAGVRLMAAASLGKAARAQPQTADATPDAALSLLTEGNARYAANQTPPLRGTWEIPIQSQRKPLYRIISPVSSALLICERSHGLARLIHEHSRDSLADVV